MEFSAILAAAYEDLGYASSPAATVVTRLKRYVNEGLQAILAEPAIYGLIEADVPYTFASVASRARYALPDGHAYVREIRDTTNDITLSAMALDAYRRLDPDPTQTTGLPTHYVPVGRIAVALQPSDASEIFVDSTSASDTNTCQIEGIVTGGYRRTATVTMTGTTAVSVSTSITDWIEITDFYLDAAAVGTVTLHEDASGGTELARITIGQKRPNYQGFYLWPTPSGANTYAVDARRDLTSLVNDTDEPPLPRDFHPMLVKYATFRDWETKDDSRSADARRQYELWLSRLKYRLASDALPVVRNGQATGISRLGGYYPADTVVRW